VARGAAPHGVAGGRCRRDQCTLNLVELVWCCARLAVSVDRTACYSSPTSSSGE
jgi:hypothetical protein